MKTIRLFSFLLLSQVCISVTAYAQKQFKLLLITTTRVWHHETLHAGVLAIQELGVRNFFDADLWHARMALRTIMQSNTRRLFS